MKRVISHFLKTPEEIEKVKEKGKAYVSPDAYAFNAAKEVVGKVASDTSPEDYILSFGSIENIKKKGLIYFQFDNNEEKNVFYQHNNVNAPIYQTCWIGEFVDTQNVEGRFKNGMELSKNIRLCGYRGVVILQNGAICFVHNYDNRSGFVFSDQGIKDIFEKVSKIEKN